MPKPLSTGALWRLVDIHIKVVEVLTHELEDMVTELSKLNSEIKTLSWGMDYLLSLQQVDLHMFRILCSRYIQLKHRAKAVEDRKKNIEEAYVTGNGPIEAVEKTMLKLEVKQVAKGHEEEENLKVNMNKLLLTSINNFVQLVWVLCPGLELNLSPLLRELNPLLREFKVVEDGVMVSPLNNSSEEELGFEEAQVQTQEENAPPPNEGM